MAAAPEEASRPATDDDLPRLAELAEAAIEELRAGSGGRGVGPPRGPATRRSSPSSAPSSPTRRTTCSSAPSTTS